MEPSSHSASVNECLPLALVLATSGCIAGGTLEGRVLLHLAHAQSAKLTDVRVELRGVSRTSIMYGMMPGIPARPARMQHSTFLTVRPASGDRVWTPGAAVPPPGVHTVELPFALDLPATLAPTFSATGRAPCEHAVMDAYIEYSVVVLAGRRGLFKRDLLLEQPVAITPCAHPVDVAARAALTAGPWPGPWKILEKQSRLSSPKSNGGYEVCVQLALPDFPSYAVSTAVPARVHIRIKPTDGQPAAFAAEDLSLVTVQPLLGSYTSVCADGTRLSSNTATRQIGLLHAASSPFTDMFPPVLDSPSNAEASPPSLDRFLAGDLVFPGTSTFSGKNVSLTHLLCLRVNISGASRDLDVGWPITLNSGVEPPPPPFAAAEAAPEYQK